ncbi:sugar dehydrogenase complex small subunit [Thioclava kandeliae]|uniref:Sugar dehydrogenase complex small subunit n=1 Tax=Thioclava kandeliae TaxID=3070818 RepID=A0ABV1SJH3_9RHOB
MFQSSSRLGRRSFLFGSATALGVASTSAPLWAASDASTVSAFQNVSKMLVNHELDPATGARIAAFAAASYPDLDEILEQISDAATARNSSRVEDFFEDLPEGPLRDFAYWVIAAWYTGSSSGDSDATLFTYEEALLYRPTLDMVPIPTFGFSAPNSWGRELFPLADLPQF